MGKTYAAAIPGPCLNSSTPLLGRSCLFSRSPFLVPGVRFHRQLRAVIPVDKVRRDRVEVIERFSCIFFVGKVLPFDQE